MKIDGNELAILQNDLDREGKKEEALKIKLEFLRQVRESGDHCPCKEACRHHGNCFECVTIHRGHRDHLPMCLWDMVNERLAALSHMTEGTLRAYEDRKAAEGTECGDCSDCPGCGDKNITDKPKRFVRFYLPISAYGCKSQSICAAACVPFRLSAEMTFCDSMGKKDLSENSSPFVYSGSILYSSSCLMRSSASGAC